MPKIQLNNQPWQIWTWDRNEKNVNWSTYGRTMELPVKSFKSIIHYSRTSHVLTVTWLDFYSGATLTKSDLESYRVTRRSRYRVTWLSTYEGILLCYRLLAAKSLQNPNSKLFASQSCRYCDQTRLYVVASTRWKKSALLMACCRSRVHSLGRRCMCRNFVTFFRATPAASATVPVNHTSS